MNFLFNVGDEVTILSSDYHAYHNSDGVIIERVKKVESGKIFLIYVVVIFGSDEFFQPKAFYEEELKISLSFVRNVKLKELGI